MPTSSSLIFRRHPQARSLFLLLLLYLLLCVVQGMLLPLMSVAPFMLDRLGLMISAVSPTATIATVVAPLCMMLLTVFGGLFLNDSNTPPYFLEFKYISFQLYGYQALTANEFRGYSCFFWCSLELTMISDKFIRVQLVLLYAFQRVTSNWLDWALLG